MYTMKSMEMTDEEQLDAVLPIPMSRPKFPPGLRICLTEQDMDKQNLDPAVAVAGGIVHIHAMARITSTNLDPPRVELQIEDMCIESEDEENEMMDAAEDRRSTRMKRLYGPDED